MAVKTAIVTGGSGGIGRACAQTLITDGFRVGILDIDRDAVDRVATEIGASGLVATSPTNRPSRRRWNSSGKRRTSWSTMPASAVSPRCSTCRSPISGRCWKSISSVPTWSAAPPPAAWRSAGRARSSTSHRSTPSPRAPAPAAIRRRRRAPQVHGADGAGMGAARPARQCHRPGIHRRRHLAPFYRDPEVRELRGGAVPSKRLGLPEDIANTVSFLASDKANYINGHHLVVDGGVSASLLTQLPRSRE